MLAGAVHSMKSADIRQKALEEYVLPELDLLYRMALTMTRDPHDAEDLVQDVLVRVYPALDTFDGRYPRAWLLKILRNTHINRRRKKRAEPSGSPEEVVSRVPQDGESPAEEEALGRMFEGEIADAFYGLPESFRTVVGLVDIEGMSYKDAAEAIGVPIGTVMSRLHRARERMRKSLTDKIPAEGGGRR